MTGLRLEQFISAADDLESAQYRILSGLQRARQAFSRNIIYPYLGELIKLYYSLNSVIGKIEDLQEAFGGSIVGLDPETYKIMYERPQLGSYKVDQVEDLIRWSLPHIEKAISEGQLIFEFVEENMHLEEVGIIPSYINEGYLMLPDPQKQEMHILHYTLSVFTRAEERFRSLKTMHVKSITQRTVYPSPQSIKLELLSEKWDLPNPATYFFATALDFPYEPTILPVAKRKFMHYLTLQGGVA